jgi:hypothetical protein
MIALARASSNCKRQGYNRKFQLKKNTGHGSQGAWRQDELIQGKPPVVKKF